MLDFEKTLSDMRMRHEQLISQKNEPSWSNGVWTRYKNPVLTGDHAPLYWRYDLNPETNPALLERFGINGTFNAGAIMWQGKYTLLVRVEGNDRKSFFAVAQSDSPVDGFRFTGKPIALPQIPGTDQQMCMTCDSLLTKTVGCMEFSVQKTMTPTPLPVICRQQ